jgi:hypothetical protein
MRFRLPRLKHALLAGLLEDRERIAAAQHLVPSNAHKQLVSSECFGWQHARGYSRAA